MGTYYIMKQLPKENNYAFVDRVSIISGRFVVLTSNIIDSLFLITTNDTDLIFLETLKGNIVASMKVEYLDFKVGSNYDLKRKEFINSWESYKRQVDWR
jgi:hypothetical protein